MRLLQQRPLAIDLFAGCGGMSLGLEAAGFDVVGAVEVDPIHALVHHFNFPYGVTLCHDISQLKSDDLLANIRAKGFTSEIELVAGGPPCQGFSMMGKRQIQDPRNQLIFEYLRFIKEIRPKYFIFENVAGMAAGQHKEFLHQLLTKFDEIGYQVVKSGSVLDASLYGAPQRRKRLFIIGYRHDVKPINYPSITTPMEIDKVKVGEAIADLADITVYRGIDRGIDIEKLNYSNFRSNFFIKNSGIFSLCHQRHVGHKVWGHLGSNHTQKSIIRFASTELGKVEKVSRFLKLHPDGLANTLRAGTPSERGSHTAPRPIHYQVPRCISVREAARLHTFPDWFQLHRKIWHGFREIGNAVIPILAKEIADEIIQALGYESSQLMPRVLGKSEAINEQVLHYKVTEACEYWGISRDILPKRKRKILSKVS